MRTTLESIILEQLNLHSGYAVEDLYKLIYQAVFGVAHLLADEKEARRQLSEEFTNLTQVLSGERLFELIDPKGIIYRINLRPYKKIEGDIDRLFDAFLLTRGEVSGTRADFLCLWKEVKQLTEKLSLPFSLADINRLEPKFQNGDPPILHHSRSYIRLNRPSYRLIAVKHIEVLYRK